MAKFLLEMLTPEKLFFKGEVEMLTVEATDGQIGILAGHMPLAVALEPAVIRIRDGASEKILANGGGFMEVTPDRTVVLCQTLEWPEDIELARVQRAIEEHEAKLKEKLSAAEYKVSKATLARALARMAVKNAEKK